MLNGEGGNEIFEGKEKHTPNLPQKSGTGTLKRGIM
jgi:hypothetical protein